MNTTAILALAEKHPSLAGDVAKVVFANPSLVPDLIGLAKGGNVLAFAKAHADLVVTLIGVLNTAVQSDPTLLPDIFAAVS